MLLCKQQLRAKVKSRVLCLYSLQSVQNEEQLQLMTDYSVSEKGSECPCNGRLGFIFVNSCRIPLMIVSV